MDTTFLVILSLMLFQRLLGASSNTMMMTSSNVTCIERERESLLIFKRSLTDRFNRLSTWAGVECCDWQGVQCDKRNGHVVKLDLRSPLSFTNDDDISATVNKDNWLRGEVSPSLLNLKHLRYIDLSMNNFSGHIPEFLGSFKCLEYLNLSNSGFGGVVPHHLGNLSRLQYLDVSNHKYLFLDGYKVYFPYGDPVLVKDDMRWLSSLSSLNHLDLSGINIGNHTDWFHPVNMLPSLVTLNMASCDISNIPSTKFINFTSLNSFDLSHNGINSTIPVWLSNLTGLMHLNLHDNYFHGRIPDFIGTLSSLSSIDLSSNQLNESIPESIGQLSMLERLYLSGNELSKSIPESIGQLSMLENFYLSHNQLSGPIPSSLGGLSSLRMLVFFDNQLSGSIPESIGLLTKLQLLSLSTNQLSGSIPESIGLLTRLERLYLDINQLSGVVSEIHFTKLNNLTSLSLADNSLTLNVSSHWIPPFQLVGFDARSCNIGPQFPNWLQTQTDLERLYLSNSSIRDRIPEWFENISSHIQYLDLSHNQIGGRLPRFHDFWGRMLRLNSNRFEGSLTSFPSNVNVLDLSDNLLSGHVPTMNPDNLLTGHAPHTHGTMNPHLEVVNLAKNHFTGTVPANLCKVLSIGIMDLSHNKLSGILPKCLGSLINLHVIDLSYNNITGGVPSSLGSLSSLVSLHLHNNRFEGDFPASLQSLTTLVTMDLGNNLFTGSIPLWIGENLSSLRILNLQSNKFTGELPLQLCQLDTLQILNVAHNYIHGMIPRCFWNFSGMIMDRDDYYNTSLSYVYNNEQTNYEENIQATMKGSELLYTSTTRFLTSLDLSSNNITGEIPDVLMNLVGLENLNLSQNLLKGQIPKAIGNLTKVESLDLSMNKLSGQIPTSLGTLYSISHLNLSFNNLSGPIPTGNQLQTLDNPSSIYEGNIGLCGPPVTRSCKGNDSSYNHVDESEGQDDTEDFWFYVGMGLGFAVGFIGLLGSLHFIRSWRIAYFETLENVYGWLMLSIQLNLARLRRKFF